MSIVRREHRRMNIAPGRPGAASPRVLIFIVAYNAQTMIEDVLCRIPAALTERYAVEVLIIDDTSADATFERSAAAGRSAALPFPVTVLFNPRNLGYGGNQKLGYHYAMANGFDCVVLLHGDGQYAPEVMGDLLEPLGRRRGRRCFRLAHDDPGCSATRRYAALQVCR